MKIDHDFILPHEEEQKPLEILAEKIPKKKKTSKYRKFIFLFIVVAFFGGFAFWDAQDSAPIISPISENKYKGEVDSKQKKFTTLQDDLGISLELVYSRYSKKMSNYENAYEFLNSKGDSLFFIIHFEDQIENLDILKDKKIVKSKLKSIDINGKDYAFETYEENIGNLNEQTKCTENSVFQVNVLPLENNLYAVIPQKMNISVCNDSKSETKVPDDVILSLVRTNLSKIIFIQ